MSRKVYALLAGVILAAGAAGGCASDPDRERTNANTNAPAPGPNNNAPGRAANSNAAAPAEVSDADRQFVMKSAAGGMKEVALGQMAEQRAASEEVKAYARRMVTDHQKANDELTRLAADRNIGLLPGPNALQQEAMDRLARLSGAAFDRAYVAEMVADHQEAVTDFERQAGQGTDAMLKAWASSTLLTLREHLQMAADLQKKVGGAR